MGNFGPRSAGLLQSSGTILQIGWLEALRKEAQYGDRQDV